MRQENPPYGAKEHGTLQEQIQEVDEFIRIITASLKTMKSKS
jgi:hypothetical protein